MESRRGRGLFPSTPSNSFSFWNIDRPHHKVNDDAEDVTEGEQFKRNELYKNYVSFEKKFGSKEGVEKLILTKQRAEYKKKVEADGKDYDSWFDWAKG